MACAVAEIRNDSCDSSTYILVQYKFGTTYKLLDAFRHSALNTLLLLLHIVMFSVVLKFCVTMNWAKFLVDIKAGEPDSYVHVANCTNFEP